MSPQCSPARSACCRRLRSANSTPRPANAGRSTSPSTARLPISLAKASPIRSPCWRRSAWRCVIRSPWVARPTLSTRRSRPPWRPVCGPTTSNLKVRRWSVPRKWGLRFCRSWTDWRPDRAGLYGGQSQACPPRGGGGHAEPVIGPAEGRTRWLCPPYTGAPSRPKSALLAEPRQIEASRERHAVVKERQRGAVLEQRGIPEWGEAIFDRRIGVVRVMLSAALRLGPRIEIRALAHRDPSRRTNHNRRTDRPRAHLRRRGLGLGRRRRKRRHGRNDNRGRNFDGLHATPHQSMIDLLRPTLAASRATR